MDRVWLPSSWFFVLLPLEEYSVKAEGEKFGTKAAS